MNFRCPCGRDHEIKCVVRSAVPKPVAIAPEAPMPPRVKRIIQCVAEHYGLRPSDLRLRTNVHEIVWPRQVAMYLIRKEPHASLPQIGRWLGGRHHTTVLASLAVVEYREVQDERVRESLRVIRDRCA